MSILDADTGGNIVTLQRQECSQLFFVYAGAKGFMEGLDPMAFMRHTGLMKRNVVLVRDVESVLTPQGIQVSYFENGISPDLPNLEAVLDWQSAYVKSLPHVSEVYTIGNSFGGWSAMFFGYMLAVTRVFALAPAGVWGRDLLRDLMVDHNGVTQYDIYYSRDIAKDKDFAEAFDGYPNTQLIVRDEHGHQMLNGLLNSGELIDIVPEYRRAAEGSRASA